MDRSLAGYSLWGCKESDMTEELTHTHTHTHTHEGCTLMNGISLLTGVTGALASSLCCPSWGYDEKPTVYSPEEGLHQNPTILVP